MRAGRNCGTDGVTAGIGWFVSDDGGYTSVAVAVALLVSITLVFSVAATEWVLARSGDVQAVADAAALAGANTVSSYCTVAQVTDACVLSMGLAGISVLGAALVASAVPGGQKVAAEALDTAKSVLESRSKFARSAAKGLRALERVLPAIIVANAGSCASANGEGGLEYGGAALPVPFESKSDFSSLDVEIRPDEVEDAARDLQDATRAAEAAKKRAEQARERAWRADCVDDPSCLSSRASALAGLSGGDNPVVDRPQSWSFAMPIRRSRAYYAQRMATESPRGDDIESITDSCARAAFYAYASDEVAGAYCYEGDETDVDLWLPHLARNAAEVRETWLYTDNSWPCTDEDGAVVLHATLSCPGALGPYCGYASVADIEGGVVGECPTCRMSVGDLGRVASISTSATNGYEHYWQIIVEESQRYQRARDEQAEAERRMEEAAEEGRGAFRRVLDQLKVPRPRICPPGAYGCVGIVGRASGTVAPSRMLESFLAGSQLPAGVAVSAATLAPDEATDGRDVLTGFFDALVGDEFAMGGLIEGVGSLWGRLLVSYGSSFERVGDAAGGFLDKVDGVFGGTVGAWLRRRVTEIIRDVGLEPADMRARKPVIAYSGDVLDRGGYAGLGKVRALVQSIGPHASMGDLARVLGNALGVGAIPDTVTIAELPIPGTDRSVPLRIDLSWAMVAS